ncbi:MAG TPA: PAS domain-containing protein [Casimicrobiaceae bacterium]|nr:PAS domain-containing protein [Casimicrobiaceae bacterium]
MAPQQPDAAIAAEATDATAMRFRAGIRLRLVLLVLALGLPFLVYVGLSAMRQRADDRSESRERMVSLARLVAARVDDYLSDMADAIALSSHGTVVDPAQTAANDAYLQGLRRDLPASITNIGLWALDGQNVGSLDRTRRGDAMNIADRPYFAAALAHRGLTIDAPLPARSDGEPIAIYARTLLDVTDRPRGVVTASARLAGLAGLLDARGVAPAPTIVTLVNAAGIILARNRDAVHWIGTRFAGTAGGPATLQMAEGAEQRRGSDGVLRLTAYATPSRVPWRVYVETPADAVLSSSRMGVAETILLGLSALVLGAVFAFHSGTLIARPLRQLASDAARFGAGDLSHRTSVGGDDELGVLARTLNRMAQTLQERNAALEDKSAELRRSAGNLELITSNVPVLITYIDADYRFRFVNAYAREVFGVDPADFIGQTLTDMVGHKVFARIEDRIRDVQAGLPQSFEVSFSPSGEAPYFLVSAFPDYGPAHDVRGAYVVCQDISRRKAMEHALADSEKRMRTIADNVPAVIAQLTIDEKFIFVNARSLDLFGLPPEALVGQSAADFLTPEVYEQTRPYVDRVKAGERTRFQRRVLRDNREHHELVDYIPDRDAQGAVVGIYALVQDVTDLHDAQAKVAESERRLRGITDNIPLLVGYIDLDRRYRFNSRYYEAWLGRPLSEITGHTVAEVLGPEAWADMGTKLERAFAGERVDYDLEFNDTSGTRHVRGSYVPDIDESGRVVGVYTSSHDVTPLKEAEQALERLAQYDALTGLPNRRRFNDGIAAALQRSRRSGIPIALLFLDIDGFKGINDTLGHAAGDEVLREFARRLSTSVRATDLVARLAGDEFVIVLEGVHGREECRFVARKILAAMRGGFHAGGTPLRVTTSIGIAMGEGAATTPEGLLKRADSALYAAKRQGRDRFEIAI